MPVAWTQLEPNTITQFPQSTPARKIRISISNDTPDFASHGLQPGEPLTAGYNTTHQHGGYRCEYIVRHINSSSARCFLSLRDSRTACWPLVIVHAVNYLHSVYCISFQILTPQDRYHGRYTLYSNLEGSVFLSFV